jgi:hypothetical protein
VTGAAAMATSVPVRSLIPTSMPGPGPEVIDTFADHGYDCTILLHLLDFFGLGLGLKLQPGPDRSPLLGDRRASALVVPG